jgi:hypothetical protein
MVVALLALFVALGGVGVAATGGNFILGQSNNADKTTALTSGVTTGPTLDLTNNGGRPAARFTAPGTAPLAVGNSKKIQNLNSDLLDGIDSTSFVRGGGVMNRARGTVQPGSADWVEVFYAPGLAKVLGVCAPDHTAYAWVSNYATGNIDIYTPTGYISLGESAGINIGSWEGVRAVQVGRSQLNGFLIIPNVATVFVGLHGGNPCRVEGQAVSQP